MKNVKRISLIGVAVLAGSLLLAGCNQGSNKAGTVDMMKLMQSPVIKTLGKSMVGEDKASQAKLKTAYEAMQAANAAVQKAKGPKTEAAKTAAKAAQTKFTGMMTAFQQKQKDQQEKIKDDISSAIASVAKEKGLSNVYIKQVVLYGSDEDVTKDVLAALQKTQK